MLGTRYPRRTMSSSARPRLTIPAVLVVSALAVGCPAGDDSDTGNETGPSTTTATGGTGQDTATAGEVPDCASHQDESTCVADSACFWEGTDIGCLVDCSMLDDQATCESLDYCEWSEDTCYTTI